MGWCGVMNFFFDNNDLINIWFFLIFFKKGKFVNFNFGFLIIFFNKII